MKIVWLEILTWVYPKYYSREYVSFEILFTSYVGKTVMIL